MSSYLGLDTTPNPLSHTDTDSHLHAHEKYIKEKHACSVNVERGEKGNPGVAETSLILWIWIRLPPSPTQQEGYHKAPWHFYKFQRFLIQVLLVCPWLSTSLPHKLDSAERLRPCLISPVSKQTLRLYWGGWAHGGGAGGLSVHGCGAGHIDQCRRCHPQWLPLSRGVRVLVFEGLLFSSLTSVHLPAHHIPNPLGEPNNTFLSSPQAEQLWSPPLAPSCTPGPGAGWGSSPSTGSSFKPWRSLPKWI